MIRILIFFRLIIYVLAETEQDNLPANDDKFKDLQESFYHKVKD